jgi:transcription initiation factor TFIIIB Brf1 subunit/transcription initiation factor TFIIB
MQIRNIADSLDLCSKVSEGAADLVVAYIDCEPGDSPQEPVMAASALYMSSIMWGKPVSQKAFSVCIGVSTGAIGRGYRRMARILFPSVGECCRRGTRREERKPGLPSG